jgi:hypothetical protein
MGQDYKAVLKEMERLLPEVRQAIEQEKLAEAAEQAVQTQVMEHVIQMLTPAFDLLSDLIVTQRAEISSEADRSLNQFYREDHPEPGIKLYEYEFEEGTGTPNRLRLLGTRLYLLPKGRLLVARKDGFRQTKKRRGFRPDQHEEWSLTCEEVTLQEALKHVVFIEAVLDTVKESLLTAVEFAKDGAAESTERTAKLMRLLDLVN